MFVDGRSIAWARAPAAIRRWLQAPAVLRLPLAASAFLASAGVCTSAQAQVSPINYERPTLFHWRAGEVAQPDDGPDVIAPDRPDFTNAPTTVGRGVQQVEVGYTYTWDDSTGQSISSHSYPETMLRMGVVDDWLELRVAWNYAALRANSIPHLDGSQDLYVGAKIALTPQTGALPATAIMPQMTLPTGSQVFTAGHVLPGVAVLYAWDITDWLALSGSTQVNQCVDAGTLSDYAQWAQSFSFGYQLTETTNAYTEWYVIAPAGADTDSTVHYIDGGFTHRLNDNVQLDIRIGHGLSEQAFDWFTGAGAAIRF